MIVFYLGRIKLKSYFVCVDVGNKMQAIDMSSGGYPYPTDDLNSVKFWPTFDKAKDYAKSFGSSRSDSVTPSRSRFEVKEVKLIFVEN